MSVYTVTGGTGYVGSKVLSRLSKNKNNKIFALIRKSSKIKVKASNITYLYYKNDEESLIEPIRKSDYLIHLAASSNRNTDGETIKKLITANITFSTLLFNTANKYNKDIVIACASTWSALDENGNYKPDNVYSATKKSVENIAEVFTDLSIHFLTLSDIYGPNDWRPKIHGLLLRNNEWPFQFKSQANQEIRMTHVNDIVEHFISSLSNNRKGVHIHDIYACAPIITLKELSKLITNKECTFNENAKLVKIPKKARKFSKETGHVNEYKTVEVEKEVER